MRARRGGAGGSGAGRGAADIAVLGAVAAALLVLLAAEPAGAMPSFRRGLLSPGDALGREQVLQLRRHLAADLLRPQESQEEDEDEGDGVERRAAAVVDAGQGGGGGLKGLLSAEELRAAAGRILRGGRKVRAGFQVPEFTDDEIDQIEEGFASGALDPRTFNPTGFERGTPEYNLAMINLLLKLGERGHDINQMDVDKPLAEIHEELQASKSAGHKEPLVCRTVPYNVCYRLDERGRLHPVKSRRPVRILRVYRRR